MLKDCQNLVQLVIQNLNLRPTKPALYAKQQGIYESVSYQGVFEAIKNVSFGLLDLGFKANEVAAILSSNRPEWVYADLGVMAAGGVVVPIYTTLSIEEIRFILTDTQATVVFVETQDHMDRVRRATHQFANPMTVIALDRSIKSDTHLIYFDELLARGSATTETAYDDFFARIESIGFDDLATVVYTSGTTGTPKGVMLTHGNVLSNIRDITLALPISDTDVVLSFLPLCHVFERTTGYYSVLAVGGAIYYAESIDTVRDDLLLARPTILISVPRLYEKMHARILASSTGLKRLVLNWALRLGQRISHSAKGRRVPLGVRLLYRIADRLVLQKVRARTGGRLRFFVSGGAPLSREIGRFFENVGFTLIEGYGLTETSPVIACNRLTLQKLGTVGKPLASQDVRIADDGELLVRGPNVMKGYLNQPEKTAEVLDQDGWFHTGDIGEIDADGYIRIVDRKKDLIVLSNGKKVPPLMLETRILGSNLISQVMVVGDNRPYLTALVVPNFESLRLLGRSDQGAYDVIMADINRRQSDLAGFEQIKAIVLLDREFGQDSGELTPSMKLKRRTIITRYQAELDGLYARAAGDPRKEKGL